MLLYLKNGIMVFGYRIRIISNKNKYYIFWTISISLLIFYDEFLTYYLYSRKWLQLSCLNNKACTRILLVADPPELPHFITPFSILDSDRYLKKTFPCAYDFVKPDVIVFLGDLTDESHLASDEDFQNYVRRFFDIFLNTGESSQSYVKSVPVYSKEREFYDVSNIFVGLSHVPLMFRPSPFVDKVIHKMLPQLIFSAHEHKTMIISTDALLRQDYHNTPVAPESTKVLKYHLGVGNMYEILIPTCSYRMGTNKIGYGYAIIESNELQFTVLWSPSRFLQLYAYLIAIVLFVFSSMCYECYRRCLCRQRSNNSYKLI